MKVIIINGPNLNTLGRREPEYYGIQTLEDIEQLCQETAEQLAMQVEWRQSNHEGEIVDWLQQTDADGIIINAAAYSHTSIAIRDALMACQRPAIEVHLSNIYQREGFRQEGLLNDIAHGVIIGFGAQSYTLALQAMKQLLAMGDNQWTLEL